MFFCLIYFCFFKCLINPTINNNVANESNVKVFKEEDLINQLLQMNPELNISDISKMLVQISLCERDNYLIPPKPYRKEDVYPWRFNREYSFNRSLLIVVVPI